MKSVKYLSTHKPKDKTTYILVHGTMPYVIYTAFTNLEQFDTVFLGGYFLTC